MADDFNSMQAALGLVGQGGSFNPLGIATPAPPAPPMVRHPGEVSRDIVRQTQTESASTLQTTAVTRPGGLSLAAGQGMTPLGAFAQQYQQNMAGINAMQPNIFSAQMMGMMGGMGSGIMPGMMPHPAMMTTPGMGIYRPFMPPPTPTVSPFPQMPFLPTPFTPMPQPAMFQTPHERMNQMMIQASQSRTAAAFATPGVAARAGADIGLGYMGAGLGASLGARFGPVGALIGGGIGAAAGVFGGEHFGIGAGVQHITDRLNPFRTTAIRGQQMLSASQDWASSGPDLNPLTGRGLSHHGALHLARRLEDTAYSSQFRRETGGMFSANDLTKITHVAGQQGLLQGAQGVEQVADKVKGLAKQLTSLMKLLGETDVVEALKQMGRMRTMGMSLSDMQEAAVDARQFSRMAGTSVRGAMEQGGVPGAMLFQQQGLSAGLGFRVGMGALGMAGAAVQGGAFTPQRLAMLGGVQGVAQHEMESSAAFLKMPMMAAAMSTMGRGGEFGVSGGALKALRGGELNINQMATMGANNLLDAVRKQGVGALGMMQIQGTEIQDQIGRLLGPQGLQATKMGQVMQTMRMMGLESNPGGFATAGLAMGMTNDQVKSMMSQANSPAYWRNLQQQNQQQQQELRGMAWDERERQRAGGWSRLTRYGSGDWTRWKDETYEGFRNVGEGIGDFFATDTAQNEAQERGQTMRRRSNILLGQSPEELREIRAMSGRSAARYASVLEGFGNMQGTRQGDYSRVRDLTFMSDEEWDRASGGNWEDMVDTARRKGGWAGSFGRAGVLARRFKNRTLSGLGLGGDYEAEETAERESLNKGNRIWSEMQRYEGAGGEAAEATRGLGERTKLGKETIDEITAELQVELGNLAKKENTFWAPGGQLTDVKAKEKFREILKRKGIDESRFSDQDIQTQLALGGVSVKEFSGSVDATAAYVETAKGKFEKAQAKGQRDIETLSGMMFGEDTSWSLLGGTQKRREKLMERLYGGGRTGQGAMLLALRVLGETDTKAMEAFSKAYAAASDKEKSEFRSLGKEGLHEEYKSELAEMGRNFLNSQGSTEERRNLAAFFKEGVKSVKKNEQIREGLGRAMGREMGAEDTIESALASNTNDIQDEQLRKYAEQWQAAEDPTAKTSIEEEAKQYVAGLSTNQAESTWGGLKSILTNPLQSIAGAMSKTERDTSKVFPQAVDKFAAAADSLKLAADKLAGGAPNTHLPPDAEWRGGGVQ